MYVEKTIQKRKANDFWTEETICTELVSIIEELKCFPSRQKLREMNRSDLLSAINKNKGVHYFREKLGFKILRKQRGYWSDENILLDLKFIISEIEHFPSHNELKEMKRSDLSNAISNHKGINYYRGKLGYKFLQRTKGYWNEERMISELKEISKNIGHFPTRKELIELKRNDLAAAIDRHSSFIKFRIILKHEIYNSGM